MTYTTNYNLPQWEDTDIVKREDVNGAMAVIDAAIAAAGSVWIESGSYIGSGLYNTANPTVFKFQHKPVLLIVAAEDEGGHNEHMSAPRGTTKYRTINSDSHTVILTWGNSSVSLVSNYAAATQFQMLGIRYNYVAFCVADDEEGEE